MQYKSVVTASFIDRPNRFVARVKLNGGIETVHVKNTGRLRELLVPGAAVSLAVSDNLSRKTKYDLIAVEKEGVGWVNIDSQAANDAADEWLKRQYPFVCREVAYGASRFDFYTETDGRKKFVEVKGVTLERDGIAWFPDAPTVRGVKHIRELIGCIGEGYAAELLFVIQMKGVHTMRPNDTMHREFGDALRDAAAAGVKITAVCCTVTAGTMVIDEFVEVHL